MELVFFAIVAVVLYIADKFADYKADQAAGAAFEQVHEVIGNVSYFGKSSQPILKDHLSETIIPFCPALTHTFKVLSRTDCGHWFWFISRVHLFRVESFSVKPVEEREAREILAAEHQLEILQEYFPDNICPDDTDLDNSQDQSADENTIRTDANKPPKKNKKVVSSRETHKEKTSA